MIFHSPYPDVQIPDTALTPFVLRHSMRLADKAAIVDGASGQALTYGELATAVQEVAAGLSRNGFRKGDVLGIYAPNCPDYAVALLAAASLGGITTPVSQLATPEELARQLTDAGANLLVTTPALLDHARVAMKSGAPRKLFVFGEADGVTSIADLRRQDARPPEVVIDPAEDVVVLPYSSGTTGLPKGVMLTHRNIVGNVGQFNIPQQLGEDDVVFCLPPFSHQYGLFLLACTLAVGGTLVILPRFDIAGFLHAVERFRVTRAFLVPPVVLLLANEPSVDHFNLSSLKVILSGAAPLGAEVMRRCAERLHCKVIQGYGLTETSPVTHCQLASDPSPVLGSVGPCLPNTECKIIDLESGVDLGPGEQGELWLRGPQVMKGYLNRPEATAAMIDDAGWIHTGDLGMADVNGNFFIIDRLKELIKYKGYQVAPAELEAVLLSHPAVADCAVIPSPDVEAGEVPKAFVVLKGEATAEELMTHVAERVAPYKKVRRIELVDAIPKSATGKILRRVLVEWERAARAEPVLV